MRGRAGLLRQHALGAVVFLLTLGLTSGALAVLHGLEPPLRGGSSWPSLIAASTAATITRFVALRSWVFRTASSRQPALGQLDPALQIAGRDHLR